MEFSTDDDTEIFSMPEFYLSFEQFRIVIAKTNFTNYQKLKLKTLQISKTIFFTKVI